MKANYLRSKRTKLRTAISNVMSTQRMTTKSLSAALVEMPRDISVIQSTPDGILERHF